MERVDTLRYMWEKMHKQIAALQSVLLSVQSEFKISLLCDVKDYKKLSESFVHDYTTVNPMCACVVIVSPPPPPPLPTPPRLVQW